MIKAEAAKMRKAEDPERVNLFKTAPLCAGDGASDGGPEIDDGVTAAVVEGASAGDSGGIDGEGGGVVVVAGEAAGETELEDGDTAAGDGDTAGEGDKAFLGGDEVGEEAGD
ncbi:hypothetical protein RIF29_41594 [Crotalaria pallida]|uniref:Uncharacterized protein n=1 Tax=Crotalaria pallida TaxID=3830 RepID=A0AAN9E5C4_CROPI